MLESDRYVLWLSSGAGITPSRLRAAVLAAGDPAALYHADASELRAFGLSPKEISGVRRANREGILDEKVRELERKGIGYMSFANEDYPDLLRITDGCPAGLYYMGKPQLNDDRIKISVIGSRSPTRYGLRCAYELAGSLAEKGCVIVSGMASGIDAEAHNAALRAGGYTVAVLGSGVDVCYPKENERLYSDIIAHGLVISEFEPGMPPLGRNFPPRNRIISGLSYGVLVVEAAKRSGTSITVGQALEQGREVFAVPGDIWSENSKGTNALIRDGAVLTQSWEDVLYTFMFDSYDKTTLLTRAMESRGRFRQGRPKKAYSDAYIESTADNDIDEEHISGMDAAEREAAIASLDEEVRAVYDAITSRTNPDELVRASAVTVSEILYALTMLEVSGLIRKLPGGAFERT